MSRRRHRDGDPCLECGKPLNRADAPRDAKGNTASWCHVEPCYRVRCQRRNQERYVPTGRPRGGFAAAQAANRGTCPHCKREKGNLPRHVPACQRLAALYQEMNR